MTALNRKLVRDLWHLRGQVMAIVLVVACGVASFVALRNIYRSLIVTQQTYYGEYRFADVFVQLKRAPERLATSLREIDGVASVQTRIVANVTLEVPGLNEPASGLLVSIPDQRVPMLNDLHIKRGRYIEPGHQDEILISSAFSEKNNLNPGDSINAIINGRWTKLNIVGIALSPEFVYEIRPGDMFPDPRRFGVMWMNREALGTAFNLDGAFNNIVLSLAPGASEQTVIERLDNLLIEFGGLGAYNREDQTSNHFVTNEIAELQVTGTFVPGVFLAVTAFLIHLVLSRLVSTQREQIAVLKAFGYGNLDIGLHYWKLAVVAVMGGIILGTLVGWYFGLSMTELYAEFFRFPVLRYVMNPLVLGAAVLISLGAATIGAIRAVRKAVALPPAESMRPEPPARYQVGTLERIGLQRLFPLAARIIIRNLERNPIKAILTTFGIALATSLLIVGFYFFDAIDQIIAIQFDTKFRHDLAVTFNEPRPSRVRYDLANLPGVLRVEPARLAAVRLRSGHYSRRTAIMGIDPQGELHRIVDVDFRVFALPPEGLVLTSELAKKLNVKAGDIITVEVLEGERLIQQIPVAQLVDELLGLGAYMNIEALNRLLNEAGTISTAYLLVDPNASQELYTKIKSTPTVSGVWIPSVWLASFNETIARTMGTSTSVIIFFACVIAFGMVYNGARIALSERGRELASLRVLGFSLNEITVMLLGEQAMLTAMAIPMGYAIGFALCFWITRAVDTELMRLPLVLSNKTFVLAFLIVCSAALLSGLLIRWRLRNLDLIEVLKTRE
ncbi:MAG: ABC transporter permease [Blastocatellia bacterium]|nr:ABC transporter permease [Blastocatellia bacterium]